MRRICSLRNVVDHEFLFETAGSKDLRTWLGGECNSTDDVGVLEGMQAFASMGVPDFAVRQHVLVLLRAQCMGLGLTLRSLRMPLLPEWHPSRDVLASMPLYDR